MVQQPHPVTTAQGVSASRWRLRHQRGIEMLQVAIWGSIAVLAALALGAAIVAAVTHYQSQIH